MVKSAAVDPCPVLAAREVHTSIGRGLTSIGLPKPRVRSNKIASVL